MKRNGYDPEDVSRHPRDFDEREDPYYFDATRYQQDSPAPPPKRRAAQPKQTNRQAPEPRRAPPSKPPKRKRGRTVLLAILIVLLVLVGGVAAAIKFFPQKPTLAPPPTDVPQEQVDPDKPNRAAADRKEDFYTFLIIGRDTVGGGNTDTIVLVSYDVPNQNLNVMSLPRDTMVNVSWDVKKLNSVYNQWKNPEDGINALDKEVSELVGFVPDFQVVVEWKAVGELVDAIGGVEFDVPKNMYKATEDVIINLKKGQQHLDGQKAMQLVRYRDYRDGDLERVKMQQQLIKALLEKCLNVSTITHIDELVKVFSNNVKVNLTPRQITWFAKQAIQGGLTSEDMFFCTMPCGFADAWSRTQKSDLNYVVPKTDELVQMVNERFNPYIEPLQPNELDIMSVDANGKISSSTGKLEDSKANKR